MYRDDIFRKKAMPTHTTKYNVNDSLWAIQPEEGVWKVACKGVIYNIDIAVTKDGEVVNYAINDGQAPIAVTEDCLFQKAADAYDACDFRNLAQQAAMENMKVKSQAAAPAAPAGEPAIVVDEQHHGNLADWGMVQPQKKAAKAEKAEKVDELDELLKLAQPVKKEKSHQKPLQNPFDLKW
jgi:hypothetical protein